MSYLTIGICTVSTRVKSYLFETINSLVENLSPNDWEQVKIVLFDCDADREESSNVKQVRHSFKALIEAGRIEIVRTSKEDYPDLSNLPTAFGDSPKRTYWRTKQCLDYSLIFKYCAGKSQYYLHLEDDVITVPNYFQKICEEIKRFSDKSWAAMQFCELGFIGILFKKEDLLKVSIFFRTFCDEMPVDWLVEYFFALKKRKGEAFIYAQKGLFQHIGHHSSLENKTSDLQSTIFNQTTKDRVSHLKPFQSIKFLSSLLLFIRGSYQKIRNLYTSIF